MKAESRRASDLLVVRRKADASAAPRPRHDNLEILRAFVVKLPGDLNGHRVVFAQPLR
jgi:hypothetical protein